MSVDDLDLHAIQFQCCEYDKVCREEDRAGSARPFNSHRRDPRRVTVMELVDATLREAGGSLPWAKLSDLVLDAWRAKGDFPAVPTSRLRDRILPYVPDQYLSTCDAMVASPSPERVADLAG